MALITTIEAPLIGSAKEAFVSATNTDDTGTIGTVMGTSEVMLCIDNGVYKDRQELINCLDRLRDVVMELAKHTPKSAAA